MADNFVNFSTLLWSESLIYTFAQTDVITSAMTEHKFAPGATQVMFPIFDNIPGGAQSMGSAPAAAGDTPNSAINSLDTEDFFEDLVTYAQIAKFGEYILNGRMQRISRQMAEHFLQKKAISLSKGAVTASNTTTVTTTNDLTIAQAFGNASATMRNRSVTGVDRYAIVDPNQFIAYKRNNFITSTLYNSDMTAGNTGNPGEYLKYADYSIWQVGGVFGTDFTQSSVNNKLDAKYHYSLASVKGVLWAKDSFGVVETISPTVELNRSTDYKAWHPIGYQANGNVVIKTSGLQALVA